MTIFGSSKFLLNDSHIKFELGLLLIDLQTSEDQLKSCELTTFIRKGMSSGVVNSFLGIFEASINGAKVKVECSNMSSHVQKGGTAFAFP